MKTLKKILWWIIPNCGGAFLLYLAFIEHYQWAWNMAAFYYWATSLICIPVALLILIAGVTPDGKARLAKVAPKITKSKTAITLDVGFDLAICFALAALDHIVLAAFYLLHIFVNMAIRGSKEEKA